MSDGEKNEELGETTEKLGGIAGRFGDDADTTDTQETNEMTETSETTGTPVPGDDEFRIREHWNGRTVYLPDGVVDDLDIRYQELSLEWQREYGEQLPKNERFYPAVVEAALEGTSVRSCLGLDDR
ncbi:hypothetical protein [Natronomonas amylolytica]|uniref:hypothetical protein n=1 Tax=Natronomonas amylolytica TaxID=3108498 RepID=UPI00300B47EE